RRAMYNPCQPSFAPLLTPHGIRTMGQVVEGDLIWSEAGWTRVLKKWSSGEKPVLAYRTSTGIFYGTENHKIISDHKKVFIGEATTIDALNGPNLGLSSNSQAVMDGLVMGDGSRHLGS